MKKNLLIVGGAGYIGSYVNKILQKEYSTLVLDNLSTGSKENVPGPLIVADYGSKETLQQIFSNNKIDAVLHFAALTNVGESVQKPDLYFENNVTKTLTLLDTMVAFGVDKLVYSSSAAIFGNPVQPKIREDHPTHPISPYGETKLAVEHALKQYPIRSCSLRYFNASGGDPEGVLKFRPEKMHNLIPVILKAVREKKPVTIYGDDYPTRDGTCIRDYVHIHDLATAHELALRYLLDGGTLSAFNLGNGEGFTVKEVIAAASKVLKTPIETLVIPRRPGDPAILLADSTLARKELHWQPIYPNLTTIIEHAYATN